MMDISIGKQEKETYVVDVRLNEEGKSYIVTYADGHQIEDDFSVHNFCAYQYRMKQQFLNNEGKIVDTAEFLREKAIIKEFGTILHSMFVITIFTGFSFPDVVNTIFLSLVGIYNAYAALKNLIKVLSCTALIKGVENVDKFVREMEHYTINVVDPNTGRVEDWYYYNISEANAFTDPKTLEELSLQFTDEFKKEEGKRISAELKRSFSRAR